ncbi:MAG: hypothetical protein ACFB15_26285 [Cyclobacteriaceae bacterium]
MPVSELELVLTERLEQHLAPLNFEKTPHLKQFRRACKGGYQCIVLSLAGQHPLEIEIFLGVRLDLVEELVYQFTMGLREYRPHSTTLLTPAKKVTEKAELRYELHQESDVEKVGNDIKEFMLTYGYDFLDQYNGVSALDQLYNANPEQKADYITNEYHRALRGVILAKLVQSQSWPELVQFYQRKLEKKGTPEVQLNKYLRLVEFLKNHSFN